MYQAEMFSSSLRGELIGNGCFASAYALPVNADGREYVLKYATSRDGTLNYLEWCKREIDAGRYMKGMPRVDRITHTVDGYVVTMPRMEHARPAQLDPTAPAKLHLDSHSARYALELPYIRQLAAAWQDYALTTFELDEEWSMSDAHHGNFLWCPTDRTFVMTDPSASSYQEVNALPFFTLQ
jgi:hypothetical protein